MATPAATRTIPWSWYSDPVVHDLERSRIFKHAWQYVGREDEVAEAGSFLAKDVGGVPVLLVCDEVGTLRAFLNVCRHRGSLVCEGSGTRATLQCPYHAWTYSLDGRLVAAPRSSREGIAKSGELDLLPLALDTWGPFVFVSLEPDGSPLSELLGNVPAQISDAGVDVEELRFLCRFEWELAANWKLAAENFLECYHCPVAHPGFSAVMDVSPETYRLETDGTRLSQYSPPRPGPHASYDVSGEVRQGQFHLLFPGTVVNVMPGRPNLSIGPIVPRAPERTYRFLDYFVAPDADETWTREMLDFDAQVGAEDTSLIERVQAGVRSGLVQDGRLLPDSERLVARFQSLVAARLA